MTAQSTGIFTCPVHKNAVLNSRAIALLSPHGNITYQELDQLIASTVHQLSDKGISEGRIVALLLDVNLEYIILLFALFRLRGIAAPINSRLPNESIPQILNRINCDILISDKTFESSVSTQQLIQFKSQVITQKRHLGDKHSYEIDLEQRATIIFSSGSTGTPKAVLHSFGNHYYSALGSNQNIKLTVGDRWLLSLPLYHVAGIAILFRSFVVGATVVIPDKNKGLDENLSSTEITHASLVSTQLQQVLNAVYLGKTYPSLKALLVGGSEVNEQIRKRAWAASLPVFFSYGLSEMSSQVTTTSPKASAQEILTSGSLLPFRAMKIALDREILVQGRTLFLGYLKRDSVYPPFDEDGWYHTGDLGYVDSKGFLVVSGRKDNMFISGGENIYPEEIEQVLLKHPEVRRIMVVPVSDEKFGKRPVAFIDVEEFGQFQDNIEAFLAGKVPRYMYPVAYIDWKEAPARTGIKESRMEFANKAEKLLKSRESASL